MEHGDPDSLSPHGLSLLHGTKQSLETEFFSSVAFLLSLTCLFRGCLQPSEQSHTYRLPWPSSQMSQECSLDTSSGEPNIKSLPLPPAVELGIQIFCVWKKHTHTHTHTHTQGKFFLEMTSPLTFSLF